MRGDARERQLTEQRPGSPAYCPPSCQSDYDISLKTMTPDSVVPPSKGMAWLDRERRTQEMMWLRASRHAELEFGVKTPPRGELRPWTVARARCQSGRTCPLRPFRPVPGVWRRAGGRDAFRRRPLGPRLLHPSANFALLGHEGRIPVRQPSLVVTCSLSKTLVSVISDPGLLTEK